MNVSFHNSDYAKIFRLSVCLFLSCFLHVIQVDSGCLRTELSAHPGVSSGKSTLITPSHVNATFTARSNVEQHGA